MGFFRALLFLIVAGSLPVAAQTASPPKQVIEALHEKLIDIMKQGDRLDVAARYRELEPILENTFDFERMIAAAAGSFWAQGSEAQRKRLLEAFSRLSITTYAARFNNWTGESFETLGERQGPRDTVLVDTRLNRPKDPAVPITYVMMQSDGRWRIIDVLLERSISELAVRRSEYNQILRSGGTEKLAQVLDEKAAELRVP
jgi:phospholipid transport system substrate-binding protein